MPTPTDYVTVKTAAKLLGVSPEGLDAAFEPSDPDDAPDWVQGITVHRFGDGGTRYVRITDVQIMASRRAQPIPVDHTDDSGDVTPPSP